jgi:membrane-associated protein
VSLLHTAIDVLLHLDRYLVVLVMQYHAWIYGLLFVVIFAETGLVVTPFLPGDSLLFGAGALSAADTGGTLEVGWLFLLLSLAAIAGNTANYAIGRRIGRRAFSGRYRLFKLEYLQRTHRFFERHGGMAVLVSRFMPIIRTFVPFVAGIGTMPYARFQAFNFIGGTAWVALFLFGGYAFGNLPWVKGNFAVVTLAVVAISLLPMAVVAWRERRGAAVH